MVSDSGRNPLHIGHRLANGSLPHLAKDFLLCENATENLKVLPMQLERRHYCEIGFICRYLAQQRKAGRRVHRFFSAQIKLFLPRLAFVFIFIVCSKNGSTFEQCLISLSRNSTVFFEISVVGVVKVLTCFFSSLTELKSYLFNFCPGRQRSLSGPMIRFAVVVCLLTDKVTIL